MVSVFKDEKLSTLIPVLDRFYPITKKSGLEGVAGRSSAELLTTFFDNILKKGGSKKLSDEAIEKTLGKVFLTRNFS